MIVFPIPGQRLRRVLFCTSALFLVQTAIAQADDITIPSGTTVTTVQTIDEDGDTLIVEDGGAIDSTLAGTDGVRAIADDQTVINNGTVTGGRHGIHSTGLRATILNYGTVYGLGTFANGINLTGRDATIINYGIIDAQWFGIDSNIDAHNPTIINFGQIFSGRVGIHASGRNITVINYGTIDALGDGIDFNVDWSNPTLTNYGTIKGGVYGVFSSSNNTSIINAGTIVGGDGYPSIFFWGVNGTLSLLAGSVLVGEVNFQGATPSLNIGSGLNLYLVYLNNEPTVNSAVPYVHDVANKIIYTIDPTGLAQMQPFLQSTAGAVHDAVRSGTGFGNRFGGGFSGNGTYAYGTDAPGFAESGPRGWVSGFGGYQSQNGSGSVTGGDQIYGGLVSGGGFASDNRMYGAFAGGAYSRLETDFDTQKTDAASFYGGIYGGMRSGAYWIEASVMGGYSDFSSERMVANNTVAGGLETASADYGGYFISPSITVGRSVGERLELSFGGNYAGLFLDGYTETGSSANMTVASRDVHVAAVRAEARYLAQQHQMDEGMVSVETFAGVDGYFHLGGGDVEASIAGLPVDAFSANFSDAMAVGFAGIGINHKTDNGKRLVNTSLEGRFGSDAFAEFRANATVAMKF
ncbi:autotransporter outer membrane beta-barrel domain-containing protein [Hoeflea sp.]|uniref:autotransporter family protein n=1 Tax=Hoeflea sp. TaxID=1940281 RepID=UPI003B01414C